MAFRFFTGLHQPSDAKHFESVCISINRLAARRKPLGCKALMIDSGAFTEVARHGGYRHDVETYAAKLIDIRDRAIAPIVAVVAQDFMCEEKVLRRTCLTIADHQRLTIERYDQLAAALAGSGLYVLPVLQGFDPSDYVRHLDAYGERLALGAWVGVGSVCKRQGDPGQIVDVLAAINRRRPDLRLHGFGVKVTALGHSGVRAMLATADSLAWSDAARRQGRRANDWREAERFTAQIESIVRRPPTAWQIGLPLERVA